MSDLV
jgi:acyl-CoA reductase-like NAD-dependent aldehyde dehydrogenase